MAKEVWKAKPLTLVWLATLLQLILLQATLLTVRTDQGISAAVTFNLPPLGSSGTILVHFKRKPAGQASCKSWQLLRAGRWGRKEESMLLACQSSPLDANTCGMKYTLSLYFPRNVTQNLKPFSDKLTTKSSFVWFVSQTFQPETPLKSPCWWPLPCQLTWNTVRWQ